MDHNWTAILRAWTRIRAAVLILEYRAMLAPLRFSLLAVLALLAVSVVAFQISYDTNDDVFMSMIVAGQGFCPAPDEHLVFSNVLLGHLLKRLYLALPHVAWYGCYLLFVHFLAQVAVLYCALVTEQPCAGSGPRPAPRTADARRRGFRRRFAAYLVYFAVVELVLLNSLQFTTTAFLAAQAGIFLLWLAARRRADRAEGGPFVPLCAAVILIVVAGLIRVESLGMALLVAAPLGLLLARRGSRRALIPSAAAAVVAALLVLMATAYNRASYQVDPAWSGFYSYNQLRCKFNDYQWTSYTPQTALAFSAVGWSKNDHAMIARWFFDDPVLYSEAKLRSVLAAHAWKTARLTPGYLLQACRRPFRDRSVWAVMLVLPFFLARMDGDRHARRALLGCATLGLALIVLVSVNNKVPPMRIYFPLLSFPLAATLLFHAPHAAVSRRKAAQAGLRRTLGDRLPQSPWTRVVVALLVVGTAMGVYRQGRRSMRVQRERMALHAFLDEARSNRQNLYVCWEAALPFERLSPFDSLASWSGLSVLNLTWTQRTPWQENVKRRFEISCLARAMSERDDIVLVATETHRSLFVTFAKEHFQTDLEYLNSRSFGKSFSAGRFRQRARPQETAIRTNDRVPR
jgi:hypothetical protein